MPQHANNVDTVDYPALAQAIQNASRAVIFTHVNPDGDAMGSSLALVSLLRGAGKSARVLLPNRVPANLRWMPNFDAVTECAAPADAREAVAQADIVFVVDMNDPTRAERLTPAVRAARHKNTVLVDHHLDPKIEARHILSDTAASSTCELVHALAAQLPGLAPGADYATCLYAGIVTDTGGFSYGASNPRTYQTVTDLLRLGVDTTAVTQAIYNNDREERVRLLGFALSQRMVVDKQAGWAYIYLTRDDQREHDYQPGDSENFVNYPLTIKEVRVSALFVERADDIKISFRSKGSFAVSDFAARHFGGGGHRNASGGRSHAPLQQCLADFTTHIAQYAGQL